MIKEKWILPWELQKSPRSKEELRHLRLALQRDGFYLDAENLQDAKGRNATYALNLLDALEEHRWVLALSNSVVLLESMAKLVPLTFALTTFRKVRTVTTEEVLQYYHSRRPPDYFESDPVGEYLYQVERCGLLVWDKADYPASAGRYSGASATLLGKRTGKRTLFLATATAADKDTSKDQVMANKMEKLDNNLREGLGRSALALIHQLAFHVSILVPDKEVERKHVVWKV